jgi:hypothetical protein
MLGKVGLRNPRALIWKTQSLTSVKEHLHHSLIVIATDLEIATKSKKRRELQDLG